MNARTGAYVTGHCDTGRHHKCRHDACRCTCHAGRVAVEARLVARLERRPETIQPATYEPGSLFA